MTDWIVRLIHNLGYVGLAFLTFLENVFPPIPSEVIIPLGGFLVAQGELTLVGVVAAGTVGSLAGGLVLYAVGRQFTQERVRALTGRYGQWLLLTVEDVEKAFAWFDRHGEWAVFLARLVPGLRSLISIPAGSHEMRLVSFIVYTTLGTAIWSAILACGGVMLGSRYHQIGKLIDWVTYVAVGLLAFGVVRWLIKRRSGGGRSSEPSEE